MKETNQSRLSGQWKQCLSVECKDAQRMYISFSFEEKKHSKEAVMLGSCAHLLPINRMKHLHAMHVALLEVYLLKNSTLHSNSTKKSTVKLQRHHSWKSV